MFQIIIKTILTFLICYAVIDIVIRFFNCLFCNEDVERNNIFVVIKVFKQEQNLEYIVRSVIWKNLSCAKGGFVPNILIVDMSNDTETEKIGKTLANDYNFIYYTSHDDIDEQIRILYKKE